MSKTYAKSSKKNSSAATAPAVQVRTCSGIQKQEHRGKRKQLPKVIDVSEVRVKKARQSQVQESALAPKKRGAKINRPVEKNLALVDADKKKPSMSRRKSPRSLVAKVLSPIAKQCRHSKMKSMATASSKPSRSETPFDKAGQRQKCGASKY